MKSQKKRKTEYWHFNHTPRPVDSWKKPDKKSHATVPLINLLLWQTLSMTSETWNIFKSYPNLFKNPTSSQNSSKFPQIHKSSFSFLCRLHFIVSVFVWFVHIYNNNNSNNRKFRSTVAFFYFNFFSTKHYGLRLGQKCKQSHLCQN